MYALSLEPMDDLKSVCPSVVTVSLDLTDWSNVRELLNEVFKNVEVDGLVNNAGIVICKPFEELTEDDYDK